MTLVAHSEVNVFCEQRVKRAEESSYTIRTGFKRGCTYCTKTFPHTWGGQGFLNTKHNSMRSPGLKSFHSIKNLAKLGEHQGHAKTVERIPISSPSWEVGTKIEVQLRTEHLHATLFFPLRTNTCHCQYRTPHYTVQTG